MISQSVRNVTMGNSTQGVATLTLPLIPHSPQPGFGSIHGVVPTLLTFDGNRIVENLR